jgi:hypothetical protein
MSKLDTKGIDELFLETPIKKKLGTMPKPVVKSVTLESASSWQLMGELFKRHIFDLQVAGFWIVLAIIVWNKLG